MSSKGRIDDIVDVPAVKKQIDYLKTELDAIIGKFGVYASALSGLNSNIKSAKGTEELNKTLEKQKVVLQEATTTTSKYKDVQAQLAAEQARLNSLNNGGAKAELDLLKVKQQRIAREKELLAQAKEAINANNKQKKSIDEQIAQARRQINTLRAVEEETKKLQQIKKDIILVEGKQSDKIREINSMIDKNTAILRQNGDAATKQRMNIGNYGSALNSVGSYLKGLLPTLSIAAVVGFGKAIFDAAEKAAISNGRLLFALKGNVVQLQSLSALNKTFRETAGISGGELRQIETMAAAANMSTKQIREITKAAVEFSSITGNDLQSSYSTLVKTLGGVGRGIKILGPEFAALTAEELKNGDAITLINEKFTGFASKSATESQKLSAAWKSLMVTLGESERGPINATISKIKDLVNWLGKSYDLVFKFGGNKQMQIATPIINQQSFDALTEFEEKTISFRKKMSDAEWAKSYAYQLKFIDEKQKYYANQYDDAQMIYLTTKDKKRKNDAELSMKQFESFKKLMQSEKDILIKINQGVGLNLEESNGGNGVDQKVNAYQQLTKSISDAKAELLNMYSEGKTPSNEFLSNLLAMENKLKDIEKAADFAMIKIIAMQSGDITPLQAKGVSGVTSKTPASTRLLVKRETQNKKPESTPIFTASDAIQSASAVEGAIYNIESAYIQANLNEKIAALNKEKDLKLSNTHLTAKQKAKIEAEYEAKQAKLRTEAAKKERRAQIYDAIAAGILSVLKAPPGTKIMTAIESAALVAQLIATPIPKYSKGRKGGPAEMAYVHPGEAVKINDTYFKTPDKETLTFLPKGADVIPNHDLMKMSQKISLGSIPTYDVGISTQDFRRLESKMMDIYAGLEMVNGTIKNKKELHAVFDQNGVNAFIQNGSSRADYVNSNIRF